MAHIRTGHLDSHPGAGGSANAGHGGGVGGTIANAAGGAANEAAPWIVRMARLGYAAKGTVYIIIGWLAARAAFGVGGDTTDSSGALRVMRDGPLGQFLLWVVAVGLVGYAIWRLIAAAMDAEGKGSEAKGVAVRLAQAGRGLLYGALGVEAARLAMNASASSGQDSGAEHWTARLMGMPAGRWLVGLAGLGVIGYAIYQLYRASSERKVRKHLALEEASPRTAEWVVRLGRFGITARAVVFSLIGTFLIRAAMNANASEAGGVGQSLDTIAANDYGPWLLAIVALGLAAYGVYQIATARFRRMGMGNGQSGMSAAR